MNEENETAASPDPAVEALAKHLAHPSPEWAKCISQARVLAGIVRVAEVAAHQAQLAAAGEAHAATKRQLALRQDDLRWYVQRTAALERQVARDNEALAQLARAIARRESRRPVFPGPIGPDREVNDEGTDISSALANMRAALEKAARAFALIAGEHFGPDDQMVPTMAVRAERDIEAALRSAKRPGPSL